MERLPLIAQRVETELIAMTELTAVTEPTAQMVTPEQTAVMELQEITQIASSNLP
jgi:hypothetical protein